MNSASDSRTVVISGAGLVGCIAAIGFANKGWNVLVYESRDGLLIYGYQLI